MRSILIVSSSSEIFHTIHAVLDDEYHAEIASDGRNALNILRDQHHDLVFIDLALLEQLALDGDPRTAMESFDRIYPSVEVVVITPPEKIRQAVKFLKAGVSDYITYPVNADEVRLAVDSAKEEIRKNLELDYLRDQFWQTDALDMIRSQNTAMRKVFQNIRSVAPTKATVLLIGETGTGKGVMARLIHMHSNRQDAQLIDVHCGAIPDTLLESELFGHEKGAFTGAHRKKRGKFEIAQGGTIFLDEVGTITPSAQIKLLQVLQDGTFSPVGSEIPLASDARIIAATNADLMQMSEEGKFRKDLYYRLNVFPIVLPPLRERLEDLTFLINTFLKKLNRIYEKNIVDVHPAIISAFKKYTWPGNIRELENLMERAFLLETTPTLTPESFPQELFEGETPTATTPLMINTTLAEARKKAVEGFERQYLKELFSRNKGKVKVSAEEAGITARQLNKLMLKYGIRKEVFKQ